MDNAAGAGFRSLGRPARLGSGGEEELPPDLLHRSHTSHYGRGKFIFPFPDNSQTSDFFEVGMTAN